MKKESTWKILGNLPEKFSLDALIKLLLVNRGFATKKDQEAFLHPDITSVSAKTVGINAKQLAKTLARITQAIEKKERIIVFGDYDVDGICAAAILWETLSGIGADALPYIPSRIGEGYGLSIAGIENLLKENPNTKLIITVDNGIVANEAVVFANEKGIDVVITDHHTTGESLPKAYAIVHTTALCGTGVAWVLSRELTKKIIPHQASQGSFQDHLALVALATVADLVPLTSANRVLLSEGLQVLRTTTRPGIIAMCAEAGISQEKIGVYEIGHILGPRLNAMGRIASAMDSLRLLCTKDRLKAKVLAEKLGITNKERQDLTKSLSAHAVNLAKGKTSNLLFVYHDSYEEGVIGLVAGRLVETYYRPAIVLSVGKTITKASARSIAGFNIIAFIRRAQHLLINAGGHPMAAGFTVQTEKLEELEKFLLEKIQIEVLDQLLVRSLRIDCELPIDMISQKLFDALQTLSPFGMGNPEPTFMSQAKLLSIKQVGKDKNHLSLLVTPVIASKAKQSNTNNEIAASQDYPKGTSYTVAAPRNDTFNAIAFGIGERLVEFKLGDTIDIVYTIDENEWNNKKTLQLKVKDIKIV